ncbi:ribosomal L1 domain-containing protein 1-like [Mangifera indica]|uniref:ribosomal L1 domain-containing protein 1-like n=1 Tax=Mangifera indica TaxID=29780 RepID=UPI001CF9A2B5|nr:ribosomal L1 domain-containing protein 1-like [Mangifera indica]
MVTTHPAPTRVSSKTVETAVNALLKWKNSKSQTKKPQLLEQDEFINLILTLKKIPQKSRTNPHKIPLPHSLIRQEDDNPPELCLIIDDRPKSTLTKDAALKKIKNDNVPITKVIKITKLKTDYRPFEAKRKLCDSYDMFFADKRVVPLLPKLLGKHFYKKKKIPVPVDLKHKNWKEQIEKVCGSALLYLRTGTCSVLKVGKVSMGTKEIVENVMAAINGIVEIVPRKWGNVRSFHLKLLESLALPVYQVVPDTKLKIEGIKVREEEIVNEEVEKENVKDVNTDGFKKKSKKKGRIHEIRYMDSNIREVFDEDELGSDDGKGDIEETDDGEGDIGESDQGEHVKIGDAEILSKKRKKGDKGKAEKLPKKVAKVKKDDNNKKMTLLSDDDKGNIEESDDGEGDIGESYDGEHIKTDGAEISSKKRKEGDKGKAEKLLKKVAKVKKDDNIKKMKKVDDVKQKKKNKEGLSLKKGREDYSGKKEKKSRPGK